MLGPGYYVEQPCNRTSTSELNVGGIVGRAYISNGIYCGIENCVNMGIIVHSGKPITLRESSTYVGGFMGYGNILSGLLTINNCANYASINYRGSGLNVYIGGIIGLLWSDDQDCLITNTINYGAIYYIENPETSAVIGGVIGKTGSFYFKNSIIRVENNVNAGKLEGNLPLNESYIGAIVGDIDKNTIIDHCFWTKRFGDYSAYGYNETDIHMNNTYEIELNSTTQEDLNAYARSKGLKWPWVALHLDGGKIKGVSEDDSDYVITTGKLFPAAEIEGKHFGFWSEEAGSKKVYDPLKSYPTDLYPVWDKYALRFDFDNRTYSMNGYDEGETIVYPDDPTKEGYVFVEWCTIDKTVCSPTNMTGESIVLHPQWEAIEPPFSSSSSQNMHNPKKTELIIGLSVGILVFIAIIVAIVIGIAMFKKKQNADPQAGVDRPLLVDNHQINTT